MHDDRGRAASCRLTTPPVGARAYDLWWMSVFEDLVERVVVAWGPSTRSWSQWAHRQSKAVIELRRHAQEPPFPGFQEFITTLEDVPFLWRSWRQVLTSVGGVYLLVHPDGDQYVGSALRRRRFPCDAGTTTSRTAMAVTGC